MTPGSGRQRRDDVRGAAPREILTGAEGNEARKNTVGRLEGKVAIVTGGLGEIGRATATRLIAEGARVTVWDTAAALDGAPPVPDARARAVDVTDPDEVSAAMREALERDRRLDVLINNAGIIRDDLAERLSLDDWDDVLRVNLKGTFIPCQAAIARFKEQGSGCVTNTASTSAFGNFGQANYSASKAGVMGLTATLALELARHGVRVNCIAPGPIETSMMEKVPEKVREKIISRIPLGRLGRVEEIAALHAFLASDDASYITGQTIICDGGLTI